MRLEAGKEMDRRCVMNWLNEVYVTPNRAFSEYTDDELKMFAHDALVLLKEQEKQKFFVDENGKIIPLPVVVRCKNCKYRNEELRDECNHWLPCMAIRTEGDWFCADGEGREDK